MLIAHLREELDRLADAGLQRRRRIVQTPCGPQQRLAGQQDELLAFCSNDYLGLAQHPLLARALAEGAQRWGTGSGASHLVSGHMQAHEDLEGAFARWQHTHIPQAQGLLFGSGFMANMALMTALGGSSTTIFSDKLNHASLIDGCRLAEATVRRYPHGNPEQLERLLQRCSTPLRLIVTDAVFSMDGDMADLPGLLRLADTYDAWLVIDDAHGLGVLGAHGHGSLEHFGLHGERLIWMGTLGKAMGVGGAVVVAHATIIDWLVQRARSYIYTTGMPPALAQALLASMALVESEEGAARRAHLQALIGRLRAGLTALLPTHPHWSLPESSTPIQPLVVGSNDEALRLSAGLERAGIWVPAIRPPTVPAGTARLRITLSAAHTAAQLDRLLEVLGHVEDVA